MKSSWIALLAGGVLLPTLAFADVSYQETTQINGGSMTGMLKLAGAFSSQAKQMQAPITTTVMVHGGRMVRSNPHTTDIIDLDAQTMTFIDHDKRTYSTVTFQQMRDQMTKAAAQMKSQPATANGANGSQMSFSAHISSTGATRQIDGQTARESLVTVTMLGNANDGSNTKAGMAATSEMWLVQDEPGMAELRRFNERMLHEMAFDMPGSGMSSLLAAQPGGVEAMEELKKEGAKVSGMPVLQVTRVGMSVDGQPLAAPSVAPLPQNQNQGNAPTGAVAGEIATNTATQTAGSEMARLGTFGRALSGSSMSALMRHTPSSKPATAQPVAGSGTDAATAGVLLENQTLTSGFSTAGVDVGSLQVPAGYKLVPSPMAHK